MDALSAMTVVSPSADNAVKLSAGGEVPDTGGAKGPYYRSTRSMDLKRQRPMLRGTLSSCRRAGWDSCKRSFYREDVPLSPASTKHPASRVACNSNLIKPLAGAGAFSFSAQFTDTSVYTPGWDT